MQNRTDAELTEWVNSPEYARREAILDWLAASGELPMPQGVSILLDLPLDITLGLIRQFLDAEDYEQFPTSRPTRQ